MKHNYSNLNHRIMACTLFILGSLTAGAYNQKIEGGTGNDCFTSVCVTKDQGYVLAGWTESNGAGGKDAWLQKYDKNQKLQWEHFYGGTDDEEIYKLVEDVDGSLLFCGYTKSKGNGGKDAWLVKLSKKGKLQWEKTIGGAQDDEAITLNIKQKDMVTEHGYFVAINTRSKGKGGLDVQTCFLSEKGILLREKLFGTTGEDSACTSQIGRYGFEVIISSQLFDKAQTWILNMNSDYESMDKIQQLPYTIKLQTASFDGLFVGDSINEKKEPFLFFSFLSDIEPKATEKWNYYLTSHYFSATSMYKTWGHEPTLITGINQVNGSKKALICIVDKHKDNVFIFSPSENKNSFNNGFNNIQRLHNGDYIVAGFYQTTSTSKTDAWWCQFSENDLFCHHSYGNNGEGLTIKRLKDGSLVVLGNYNNNFAEIFMLDAKGKLRWSHRTDSYLFSDNKKSGLLILDNETIVVCLTDSLLGYRQDGTKLFAKPRKNAATCPILLENNRFMDVRPTGLDIYDEKGTILSQIPFERLPYSKFILSSANRLRDGSLVLSGFVENEGTINSVDGFSFHNDTPCAICYDASGKLRWAYRDDDSMGQYNFLKELADGRLALYGRVITVELNTSTMYRTLDTNGKPIGIIYNLNASGYPKQLITLSDTAFLIVGQNKSLTLSYPNRHKYTPISCPAGDDINDIILLPDSSYIVTGNVKANDPLPKRMMVARLSKQFELIPF